MVKFIQGIVCIAIGFYMLFVVGSTAAYGFLFLFGLFWAFLGFMDLVCMPFYCKKCGRYFDEVEGKPVKCEWCGSKDYKERPVG